MATQSNSNLLTRIGVLQGETTTGANTASRVGTLLRDLLDSVPVEFDPAKAYPAGQWVIYQGRLVKSFSSTTAGQTPLTHPAKWIDKTVRTKAALLSDTENLPVTSQALIEYVTDAITTALGSGGSGTIPYASETVAGLVRRASELVATELSDNAAYITPFTLNKVLTKAFETFTLQQAGTLDQVLANGNASNQPATIGQLSEVNPSFVSETTALMAAVYDTVKEIWTRQQITFDNLMVQIRKGISLTDVTGTGRNNTSNTVGVGNLTMIEKPDDAAVDRLAGFKPIPTTTGNLPRIGLETISFVSVVLRGLQAASPAIIQQMRTALQIDTVAPFIGTVTGTRCETVEVTAGGNYEGLIEYTGTLGTPQNHGLVGYQSSRIKAYAYHTADNTPATEFAVTCTATTYTVTALGGATDATPDIYLILKAYK